MPRLRMVSFAYMPISSSPTKQKTVDNGAEHTEPSSHNDEMPSVSQIFKFLMSLQLGLMIFPVLHSLHEHVWQACLDGGVVA
jgi:hypothetical protein